MSLLIEVHNLHYGLLFVLHNSMGFHKCIVLLVSHYSIIYSCYIVQKNLLCSKYMLSPTSKSLTTIDLFIVPLILPFSELHMVGLYKAFLE